MHLDNADIVAGTVKGKYVKTNTGFTDIHTGETTPILKQDPNYLISDRGLQTFKDLVYPTSPLEYLQNNEPVIVQTEQGTAIVPTMRENYPSLSTQPIVRADLPQDQTAYKENAIPLLNLFGSSTPKKSSSATVELKTAPVQTDNTTLFVVIAIAVVLLIISKW